MVTRNNPYLTKGDLLHELSFEYADLIDDTPLHIRVGDKTYPIIDLLEYEGSINLVVGTPIPIKQ